jgi:hypothetical protein
MAQGRRRLSRDGQFPIMVLAAAAVLSFAHPSVAATAKPTGATAKDWLALSKLPDWTGSWVPDVTDQKREYSVNEPPWTAAVAPQIAALKKQYQAGNPALLLSGCLPHGMPTLMLITHNALEFLFTPGRVTMLGESDGNRLRRIYTDGRPHPDDPDLTYHGHSIGHWEGQTLVVDTVGVTPEAYIATDEAVGIPNNGGMHIVERIHISKPDLLVDELEITAPKVLTGPWKTTRIYHRQRGEKYEIVEGECEQGNFSPAKDKYGNFTFKRIPEAEDGSVVPRTQ